MNRHKKILQNMVNRGVINSADADKLNTIFKENKILNKKLKKAYLVEFIGFIIVVGLFILFWFNTISNAELWLFLGVLFFGTFYTVAITNYISIWSIYRSIQTFEIVKNYLHSLIVILIKEIENINKDSEKFKFLICQIQKINEDFLKYNAAITQYATECQQKKRGLSGTIIKLIGQLPQCKIESDITILKPIEEYDYYKSNCNKKEQIYYSTFHKGLTIFFLLVLFSVGYFFIKNYTINHNFIALLLSLFLIILLIVPVLFHFYQAFFVTISWDEKALYYGKEQKPIPWEKLIEINFSDWIDMVYLHFDSFGKIRISSYMKNCDQLTGFLYRKIQELEDKRINI